MQRPVIVSAVRTPSGRFLGRLKTLQAPELGAIAVREAVRRAGVDPAAVPVPVRPEDPKAGGPWRIAWFSGWTGERRGWGSGARDAEYDVETDATGNAALSAAVAALRDAGHTLVDSEDVAGFAFDLPTLQNYDGVFFALPPSIDQNVLINYVNAGGNVYINGGTGIGGAPSEAADWNTFLNAFGLNFAAAYNGIQGVIPIASGHPVMAGVPSLYQNNGNTITLVGGNPNAQIIATSAQGQGLYAVYDATAIPEPGILALFGIGVLAAAARRRTR